MFDMEELAVPTMQMGDGNKVTGVVTNRDAGG